MRVPLPRPVASPPFGGSLIVSQRLSVQTAGIVSACILERREGVSRHRVSVITGAIAASPGTHLDRPYSDGEGERLSGIERPRPLGKALPWTCNCPFGSRSVR